MKFKVLSNDKKSVNILNDDGSIVFRVNPMYPLSRLMIDGFMDEELAKKLGVEKN